MTTHFSAYYFSNNIKNLRKVHEYLKKNDVQDEELESIDLVRSMLTSSLKIKGHYTVASVTTFQKYLLSFDGINNFLRTPLYIHSIYIVAAMYIL